MNESFKHMQCARPTRLCKWGNIFVRQNSQHNRIRFARIAWILRCVNSKRIRMKQQLNQMAEQFHWNRVRSRFSTLLLAFSSYFKNHFWFFAEAVVQALASCCSIFHLNTLASCGHLCTAYWSNGFLRSFSIPCDDAYWSSLSQLSHLSDVCDLVHMVFDFYFLFSILLFLERIVVADVVVIVIACWFFDA